MTMTLADMGIPVELDTKCESPETVLTILGTEVDSYFPDATQTTTWKGLVVSGEGAS